MADRTSSSIVINAGKHEVMAVVADFPAYPKWTSSIKRAEILSTDAGDRPERVRFNLEAGPIKDIYVLAYEWDGDDAVRWHMDERGTKISNISGSYRLTDSGGGTEVTHELAVEAPILKVAFVRRQTEKMIIDMALNDLKRRVEQ
ncbi:MAG TPA: SRPBCC family protein [Streptosporangiaceae bacterium]|nr:SRPBCC family protein [Streptosporangiaceae bacterium]